MPGTAAVNFSPVEPLAVTFDAVPVVCVVLLLMLFCAVVTDAAVTVANGVILIDEIDFSTDADARSDALIDTLAVAPMLRVQVNVVVVGTAVSVQVLPFNWA